MTVSNEATLTVRQDRRLMVYQRFRRLPANHAADAATVQDKACHQLRAEYARFPDQALDPARDVFERFGLPPRIT